LSFSTLPPSQRAGIDPKLGGKLDLRLPSALSESDEILPDVVGRVPRVVSQKLDHSRPMSEPRRATPLQPIGDIRCPESNLPGGNLLIDAEIDDSLAEMVA